MFQLNVDLHLGIDSLIQTLFSHQNFLVDLLLNRRLIATIDIYIEIESYSYYFDGIFDAGALMGRPIDGGETPLADVSGVDLIVVNTRFFLIHWH